MKGKKQTSRESKRGRADYETDEATDELIDLPADIVAGLRDAIKQGASTASVRINVGQTVNLGRLDAGRKYESVRFDCAVELPVPAKPEALERGLDLARKIAENEVNGFIEELERALDEG